MLGASANPDMLLSELNIPDFDAIVFVGGTGASEYWDNPNARKLAQQAANLNLILGAICIAPVTLAKAGVLEGKNATVWPSESAQLKNHGVNYTGPAVQVDGNIITADGPQSASLFANALVKALAQKKP